MKFTLEQIEACGWKWPGCTIRTRNMEITYWDERANSGRLPTRAELQTWTAEYLARSKSWEEMNRVEQAKVMNEFLATRSR